MLDKLYVRGERIFQVCKNQLQRRPKGDESELRAGNPQTLGTIVAISVAKATRRLSLQYLYYKMVEIYMC